MRMTLLPMYTITSNFLRMHIDYNYVYENLPYNGRWRFDVVRVLINRFIICHVITAKEKKIQVTKCIATLRTL